MTGGQVQVVGLLCGGPLNPRRYPFGRGGGVGGHRLKKSVQARQCRGSSGALLFVESAQALQPGIEGLVQLRPQGRRFVQELTAPVPHGGRLTGKGALAGEHLVEDDARREDVRRSRSGRRLAECLRRNVGLFHQIHDVRRDRQTADHAGSGEVKVGDAGGAVLPDQHSAGRQVAMNYTVLMGMC